MLFLGQKGHCTCACVSMDLNRFDDLPLRPLSIAESSQAQHTLSPFTFPENRFSWGVRWLSG